MKYGITILLFSTGCATLTPDYTIFLKEENNHLKNFKDETCNESGYQLRKQKDGKYRLTVYYSNCDVEMFRLLKEREKEHWILPPDTEKQGTQP